MIYLIAGLIVFLGVHSISIFAPHWRDATAARLGVAWRGIYSLISIAGFVLLVWGFGQARVHPIVLYTPPAPLHWITAILMLPVFPLLLAPYFPGRIQATLKHPMLVATKTWALAHLLSNGTLADVLLFGGFLAWAVADRVSYKHRVQRPLPGAPPRAINDVIVIIVGLAIYYAFVRWLHLRWIGVAPMA
jgi:uncharacterized membrane protein